MRTKSFTVPAWWMAVLVMLLLAFGLPPMAARFIALSGDPIHMDILEGRKVSEADLSLLEASRRRVVAWFPTNEYYNDLALAAFDRGARLPASNAASYYREAAAWQVKALAVSPADPYGWYRLSYFQYVMDGGPSAAAAKTWRQSMITAPYEPRLTIPRLQMGMSLGTYVGPEMRGYILRLARAAWREEPERLIGLASRGTYLSIVEEALGDNADELAKFRAKVKEETGNGT
ncbi:MAG: hypothetical protein PHW63_01400 [Alphaproteobacteria bacterium]|nr:hypothetical protein [Alphaproteobacteria bacterium]